MEAMTSEREAFEAAVRQWPNYSERTLARDGRYPEYYGSPVVQGAWEGWKARAHLAQPAQAVADKRTTGVYHKFNVTRTDGSDQPGGKHHGCEYFVLDLTHDPFAKPAAAAYADACESEYPVLAADMRNRYGLHAERARVPDGMALVPREMVAEAVQVLRNVDTQFRATGQPSARIERAINALSPLAAAPSQRAEVK